MADSPSSNDPNAGSGGLLRGAPPGVDPSRPFVNHFPTEPGYWFQVSPGGTWVPLRERYGKAFRNMLFEDGQRTIHIEAGKAAGKVPRR
jgi:hypothetical protein